MPRLFSPRSRDGARAFTLLELIVVIVILGVLAGIAIPTFLTSQSKARDAVTSESLAATAHNAAALAALDQAFSDGNFSTAASESNLTALSPGLLAATSASAVAYNSSTGAGYASRPGVNGASGATAFTLSYQISPDKQSAGLAVVAPSGNCLMDVVSLTSNQKPWSYADLGANCNGSVALAGPTQPTPSKVAPGTPTAVTGFTAAVASGTSVNLAWSAPSTGAASYQVTVSPAPQTGGSTQSVSGTATSYQVQNLSPSTSYTFTIVAQNVSNVAGPSASAGPVTTWSAALVSPSGLSASAGSNTVSLSWSAVSNAVSYNVYRGGTFLASSSTPSYTDNTAVNGTTYSYQVSSVDNHGQEGAPSAAVTARPLPAKPGQVTGVSATAGNASVTLSWTALANSASYNVYQGAFIVTTVSAPSTSTTITGLTNGQSYSFQVSSVDAYAQEGTPSAAVSATPYTTASAPTALTLTPGQSTMAVSWTAPSSTGGSTISSYTVSISPAPTSGPATQSVSGTSASFANLVASTSYTVSVSAQNAAGSSAATTASATTWNATLSAPSGLTATPGNTTVALSWSAVSGATSYNVYRGGTILTTVTAPTTSYTDTGLSNGTSYSYQVSAVDASAQESAPSAPVSASTYGAPGAPTAVSASATSGRAAVSFTAPAANGGAITSYTVTSSGGQTASGFSSPIVVYGLTNGVSYTFSVAATNSYGTGPVSAASSAVTPSSTELSYTSTISGCPNNGSNCFDYRTLSTTGPNYTVQAGDRVEWWQYSPTGGQFVGVDLTNSAGAALRDSGVVDENGYSTHPEATANRFPTGQWLFRSAILPAGWAGTTITNVDVVNEMNDSSPHGVAISQLVIRNSAGTITRNYWSPGDAVPGLTGHLVSHTESSSLSLNNDGPTAKALFFTSTETGCPNNGTNCYDYRALSTTSPNYTLQSGDTLEWWQNVYSGSAQMGLDFTTSGGSALRTSGAVDQNGVSTAPGTVLPTGAWLFRKVSIPGSLVGQSVTSMDLVNEMDDSSQHSAGFANIVIRNSSGAIVKSYWQAGDVSPSLTQHMVSGVNSASDTLWASPTGPPFR